jgi:hypothetical protein
MVKGQVSSLGRYIHTICKIYVTISSCPPKAAAAKAEKKKRDLFSQLPNEYLFCLFAVETLGTYGEEALRLVRELGGHIRGFSGDTRETFR